jgi:hypothetical protein
METYVGLTHPHPVSHYNIKVGSLHCHYDTIYSMPYTYNDIRLTYNSTISTYNGDEYFLPIGVYEVINISENFARLEYLFIYDDVQIDELVTSDLPLTDISLQDLIHIMELQTVENKQLGGISVDDSATIYEDLFFEMFSNIPVWDDINITEDISNTGETDFSISDSMLISEFVNAENPWLGPIDEIAYLNILEDIHPELVSFVNKDEVIESREVIFMESFKFSPSDIKPVGKGRNAKPTDGKLAGFF